jgi:hypothetical protein
MSSSISDTTSSSVESNINKYSSLQKCPHVPHKDHRSSQRLNKVTDIRI